MLPRERRASGQHDLFRSRLDQIVDMKHPLAKLGGHVDWMFLEKTFGAVYQDGPGQPPLPTRLMAGLAILKHTYSLSDEALCERWVENPSHGEVLVKVSDSSVAHELTSNSYSDIQGLSPITRPGRLLARSTSHSVAVHDGSTKIPLAAVGAQEDKTILFCGFSGHRVLRFVHPDSPELIKF